MTQEKTKPVAEIRVGRIKAAIWKNSNENGDLYNVTFSRLYRLDEAKRENKKDKGWRNSDSFGRDDLLLLAKIADQAHSYIIESPLSAATEE